MPNHEAAFHMRAVPGMLIVLLIAASVGWGQSLPSQEGLPPELVIADEPPLADQLRTMEALFEAGKEYLPAGGILNGIKSMFTTREQAVYLPLPEVVEIAASIRGNLIETEGMYHLLQGEDEGGILRSMGAEVKVELMGGTTPLGFEAAGGSPDGMPVQITGRIETEGDAVLLRAEQLVPSAALAGVRKGRILELQENWEAAVKAYEEAAGGALAKRPLAAFARIRAAQLVLEKLHDEKRARGLFSTAWQPYSVERNGEPVYYTWIPKPNDGWERVPASEAIAPRLDRLNSQTIAYRIVDLFVRMAGNSAPLGVLLMAVVVRLAIFPLTKKQLESQRRMQALQPQIKELQQKYATDKQKFQEEFWKLCQENNCNPLGGCLPMLVQMPILIFLYRGIRDYIVQFDGQSFLWVSNLAQPNTILLILYTISMVFFQKMAAQTQPVTDPQQAQQQKMMTYMMPLMFFFFFQSFPAAFILYWLGSNLIYFGEQALYLRKHNAGEESEEVQQSDRKSGGFINAMLDSARRLRKGGADEKEQSRLPSFEEKRRQEKQQRKRGRNR